MFRHIDDEIAGTIGVSRPWFHMEYRGKPYTIVQGIGPDSWKWRVELDEKTVKSGEAPTRAAAMASVIWAIDKALASKKPQVAPPKK